MNPQDTKPKQSSQRDISNGNLSQNEDNTGFKRNSSYVTIQPDSISGYNFDPQIRSQYANEPDYVHATRPIEPQKFHISPELKAKHEQAKLDYPYLNLSEGEYVILDIKRHPVGLWGPLIGGIFSIVILLSMVFIYPIFISEYGMSSLPGFEVVFLCSLPICLLIGLFTYINAWVYMRNQFFLTNESVIQEIQRGLFSRHEQTVSLGSIEDASFEQNGVLQTMLNYGSIRLSTEGEETTYRFYFVSNPKEQIARLNNAVESFKNGRPVE